MEKHSVKFKLLTIVFAGIILVGIFLTGLSSLFIRSCFNKLYEERLAGPSRTLLSQYTHADIAKHINILKSNEGYLKLAAGYLADREFVAQTERGVPPERYTREYDEARERMFACYDLFADMKDVGYYAFYTSMLQARTATGIKNLYILADLDIAGGYVFIFNAIYQADTGFVLHDDFGTAVSKAVYPEIKQVYDTGRPVYVINKDQHDNNGRMSHSFTPVKDGYGNIVAVICVDVNLEAISTQFSSFIQNSIFITLIILVLILLLILLILQKAIIRPVNTLTAVSSEIAQGNVYTNIPQYILSRRDEMGVLGKSFESMREALEKLILNNESLLEAAMIGKLNTRGDSSKFSGLFARLIDNTNDTLDVIGIYFNSIPASLAVLDPSYDIVFSNSTFQKTFAKLSAARLYQVLLDDSDEDHTSLKEKLSAAFHEGEYNRLRWLDLGGVKRCFSFMCSTVRHGSNDSGAVIVILDSTEMVEAKDKALSASKAKSEFLSRVSHELRTPLNAVLSLAKLGLHDTRLEQSIDRFEKIVSSSSHLSNIINDVLEMSRMESGKTEIRYAPFNVFTLIRECMTVLYVKAEENGNQLISQVEPGIPDCLLGDAFRIKQIMFNLLSNSAKFTTNGSISIETACVKRSESHITLRFSVTDTGIGMSEEFLNKIFSPFEQEDSFLSRRYAGSGLGLSISKNLVTLMGGEMSVQSEPGKGSRFVFTLPFEKAYPLQLSAENTEGDETVSLAGKRILLVDDIEINRMIIFEVLNDSGVQIEEAADGEEALKMFVSSPPFYYDCILMDIQMPKMNGYKATEGIRKSRRVDCGVPVIAMTANALKEDVDEAFICGMDDHLAKPIEFDLCIKTVQKWATKQHSMECETWV